MKKLIPGILATALCFTCFATACGGKSKDKDDDSTPSAGYNVENAAAALKTVYGGQIDELDGRTDFDVPNTWGYQGAEYTVTWTATAASEGDTCPITLYPDGDWTEVAVNKLLAEETQYYLTATVTAPDGSSKTTPILGIVNPVDQVLSAKLGGDPTVGTEYVLSMFQVNRSETLYLTGEMNDWYYQTSNDSSQAKTILVEENTTTADVTNDYYMYYLDGETKTYLNVVKNGTHNNVVFETTASSSWVYTADIGTMLTTLGEGESAEQFFLGTFGSNNTISACAYPKYKDNFKAGLAIITNRADVADSVRVNDTLSELSVPAVVVGAYTQKLATSGQVYPEATVTWSLAEGTTAASLNTRGSKLTTTDVSAKTEISLTATVTSGEVSQTKSFTLNVVPNTEAGILEGTTLLESGDEFANEVSLTGTVSKIVTAYNAEKGTVTFDMTVGESTIQAYSAIGGNGVSPADVKVGDTTTVRGILTRYKDTIEFDSKCVIDSLTPGTATPEPEPTPDPNAPEAGSVLTIPQAIEFGNTFDKNAYSTDKYYVEGTIVDFYGDKGTTYGNVYIKDADDNQFLVYGLYNADGSVAYKNMDVKPVVGDYIKVYGVIGKYDDAQMKDGWVTVHTPTEKPALTPAEIVDAAYALENSSTLGNYTLTGVISKIDSAWSTEHNNITVSIIIDGKEDMPIQCFRLAGTGADTLAVGNTITVTGTISKYHTGVVQFAQGSTLDKVDTEATVSDIAKAIIEANALVVPSKVEEDSTITLATVGATYNNVSIAWASDNACAVVDGGQLTVTLPDAATSVTLTATVTCGEVEKVFTFAVAVSAKPVEGAISVTKVAEDMGYADKTELVSANLDDVITISSEKGTNTNNAKYYESGAAFRVYAGNIFTISAAEGYKIISIEITTGESYSITSADWVANASSVVGTGTETVIITPDGNGDVTITKDGTSGQWRVVAITVTYVAV